MHGQGSDCLSHETCFEKSLFLGANVVHLSEKWKNIFADKLCSLVRWVLNKGLKKDILNPFHIKASNTNRHSGPGIGLQVEKRTPEVQDKRTLLSKLTSVEA